MAKSKSKKESKPKYEGVKVNYSPKKYILGIKETIFSKKKGEKGKVERVDLSWYSAHHLGENPGVNTTLKNSSTHLTRERALIVAAEIKSKFPNIVVTLFGAKGMGVG